MNRTTEDRTHTAHDAPGHSPGRRRFLRTSATAPFLLGTGSLLLGSCSGGESPDKPTGKSAGPAGHPIIHYGLSFIHGKSSWNRVRFAIESRTRIIDERTGRHEDFYQCASCKSESTFAEQNLFSPNNFDYIVVFGGGSHNIQFRRTASLNHEYRRVTRSSQMWDGHVAGLRDARSSRLLSTNEAIRKATHDGLFLVGQTEIVNREVGLRAIVEFPIKTMNIHDEKNLYQVDTGPVAYPDLSQGYRRLVDSLFLAFVAFNKPDSADFIIEDVTPILEFGREVTRVHHYSRTVTVPAQNRLFAIEV